MNLLVDRLASGRPARLLLIVVGNVSNAMLLGLVERHLRTVVEALWSAPLVELQTELSIGPFAHGMTPVNPV